MSGRPDGAPSGAGEQAPRRQFVKFTFFKVDPEWRRLPASERADARRELCEAVDSFGDRMLIGSYSLVGLRGDAELLLWQVADQLEDFQALTTRVFSTAIGPYLSIPYSYFAMTRRSIYRTPREIEDKDARLRMQPSGARYLFVYPFVKTRAWYALSKDERQAMMDEHITVGRRYPSVKLNTTYSYGLDDQEFVVSFETDSPADFLDLVMELRESRSSAYTLRDTPTFTCVAMPLAQALESLGAPGDAVEQPAAATGRWAPAARLEELPEGGSRVVYVGGEQVALFHLSGRIYAIGNRCPHANGPLADGAVEGTTVTCPYHGSRFDVTTGEALGGPAAQPAPVYEVRVEDGVVLVAAGRAAAAS